MSVWFRRFGCDAQEFGWRRLACAASICVLISCGWYGVRASIVRYFANASIGNRGRYMLVINGFEASGHEVEALHGCRPQTQSTPTHCVGVNYSRTEETLADADEASSVEIVIVDSQFNLRGMYSLTSSAFPWYFRNLPLFVERGGSWLLRVEIDLSDQNHERFHQYQGLIRMKPDHNELVWLGLIDISGIGCRAIGTQPVWEDQNGNGIKEWVYSWKPTRADPVGGQPVAIFESAEPGGILRTLILTEESQIVPWTPASATPLRIEHDEMLDEVFRKLLPPPPGL